LDGTAVCEQVKAYEGSLLPAEEAEEVSKDELFKTIIRTFFKGFIELLDAELVATLDLDNPDFLPDLATKLNKLGNRLSALGRREEALEATREAVEIRRRLASSRPDAFLPDLALNLNNLGYMLSDLGRHEEALAAADEAVRTLAPFFERLPEAFARSMRRYASNYQEQAADAGRPVDDELLGPILADLERLGDDG
jgi:tetratricopeptide (TPR) repeat protein